MKFPEKILFPLLFLIFSIKLFSQENSFSEEQNSVVENAKLTTLTVTLPEISSVRKNVHAANYQIALFVSDLEGYLSEISENDSLELIIEVQAFNSSGEEIEGVFDQTEYSLIINEHNYQTLIYKDVLESKNDLGDENFNILDDAVQVEVIDINGNTDLTNYAKISLTSTAVYGYDVNLEPGISAAPPSNMVVNANEGIRNVELSWDMDIPYSAYELQLWRIPDIEYDSVFSEVPAYVPSWDKGLSLIIPVDPYSENEVVITKNYSLSVIEGSGIYLWRVRSIGGYSALGFADPGNYGVWPTDLDDGESISLNTTTEGISWFRFSDPDSSINTIHSKIFTEEGKTKQVSTYADGLNNVKQTQTYLPSVESTIITQQVQDFSGRTSLTSIPVPVDNEINSYKERFMLNEEGKLYTAENFDDTLTGGIPETVLETGAFAYYNNNTDQRIPNSEGYPFIRTLYYNDGSGRVKEQSAPGSVFAINEEGTGHTIKYYYGVASETELLKLFGSDAPNHENVSKTVVIDQNGIGSVTYTTREGQTIATSLILTDTDQENLLALDTDSESSSYTVTDKTTENIATEYGFYSSKRLFIPKETALTINYTVNHEVLDKGCTSVEIDCNFQLEVSIIDLNSGEVTILFPDDETDGSVDNFPSDGIQVTIPSGSYLIQKKLFPGEPETNIDRNTLENKILPLSNLLKTWMDKVVCNSDADTYYSSLNILQDYFEENNLDNLPTDAEDDYFGTSGVEGWSDFVVAYGDLSSEDKAEYTLNFYSGVVSDENIITSDLSLDENIPEMAYVTSPCCAFGLRVKYVPYINFDPETWGYSGGKYYPDFEGFALDYLSSCLTDETEDYFYKHWMAGWPEGVFNEMVYRMLTDTNYATTNPITEGDTSSTSGLRNNIKYDECGNEINANSNYYQVYDLFNCWKSALTQLKSDLGCISVSADVGIQDDQKGKTLSDLVDEDQEDYTGEDQDSQDTHFDDNFNIGGRGIIGRAIRWFMKRKMSKRMRSKSPSVDDLEVNSETGLSDIHLVEEFLNCTGYHFAKVLTPLDPYPLSQDEGSDPLSLDDDIYTESNSTKPYSITLDPGMTSIVYYTAYTKGNRRPYSALSNWVVKRRIISDGEIVVTDTAENVFPYITNPIYAFKYFEYPYHGDSLYNEFEANACFDDPNDCFQVDANGWVIVDATTKKPNLIPCCFGRYTEEAGDFCYKNHDYPNLEYADVSDNRFGNDDDGEGIYRYTVNEFADVGRLSCPYDHEVWSSLERETFYMMLKSYEDPYETWETEIVDLVEDCDMMINNATHWWNYTVDGSVTGLLYPSDDEPDSEEGTGWEEINYEDYYLHDATIDRDTITRVEIELAEAENECESSCYKRKSEMRRALYKTLDNNCYDIGGCYTEETPWAIPESHIEAMLDTVYKTCLSKCSVYTFACEDIEDVRDVSTHRTNLGPISISGGYSNLYIGLAMNPDEAATICNNIPLPTSYVDCANETTDWATKKKLTTNSYIWNIDIENFDREDYSWYEYTDLEQVSSWKIELSLPSMCESRYGTEGGDEFTGDSENNFVPKDEYEIPESLIDQGVVVGEGVISPAVNIELEVE